MLAPRPAADALARPSLPAVTIDSPAAPTRPDTAEALFAAAQRLLPVLEAGRPLDAAILRDAMTRTFGASDAAGGWVWKDAYEAAEVAAVLFVARHGRAMRRNAGAGPDGPARMLAMLEAVAALEPSHTKRSEEQVRLQQFSTPLALAYAVLQAAAIRPGDTVLEPSAGTGMLAVMAACALGDPRGRPHPPRRRSAPSARGLLDAAAGRTACRRDLGPMPARRPRLDRRIDREARAANAAELLGAVIARVPPRLPVEPVPVTVGTDAGPDTETEDDPQAGQPPRTGIETRP